MTYIDLLVELSHLKPEQLLQEIWLAREDAPAETIAELHIAEENNWGDADENTQRSEEAPGPEWSLLLPKGRVWLEAGECEASDGA